MGGDPPPNRNSADFDRIEVPHRLDKERGIVITPIPLVQLDDNGQRVKADVYYVCSYNVRDQSTYTDLYYSYARQIANNGTGDLPLHRPDLNLRVVAQYNRTAVTGITTNQQDLDQQLDTHIQALAVEFQEVGSVVKRYRGLIPILIDGAIRHVSYFGVCDGPNRGCFTMASQNTEWEPGLLVRPERRRRAEVDRMLTLREIMAYDRRRARRQGVLR